jgi:hypothetical protein
MNKVLLVAACSAVSACITDATSFGLPSQHVFSNIIPSGGGPSRIIAADEKETQDMEVSVPLSQAAILDNLTNSTLMRDIQMLSDILAEVVERENPQVHDLYCQMRELGLER